MSPAEILVLRNLIGVHPGRENSGPPADFYYIAIDSHEMTFARELERAGIVVIRKFPNQNLAKLIPAWAAYKGEAV